MTYNKETKTLTAAEGKEIVRTADGTRYGSSVRLGYCHYIGGRLQRPPHPDTPDDFHEESIKEVSA